jgi:tetratricopeptide (TPR) repeat protein
MKGTHAILVTFLSLLGATGAHAQIPDQFTNLEIFPKDVSRSELLGAMRSFSGALGVRCGHCHASRGQDPGDLEKMDFASDAKWEKKTARAMMKMAHAINGDYLAHMELGPSGEGAPKSNPLQVQCVTCHHGLARPETIDAVLAQALAKDGPDGALRTYKELRGKYLTSGSYDFGERPLNALAERLADEGHGKEATAVAELSVEYNPDSGPAQYVLGQARLAAGERAKAIEAIERSLVLDPKNPRARKKLDELKAPASPKP